MCSVSFVTLRFINNAWSSSRQMEGATAAYEKDDCSILELSLYENCFHLDQKDSSHTRKI